MGVSLFGSDSTQPHHCMMNQNNAASSTKAELVTVINNLPQFPEIV